ncbi:MAG TPA: pilus assembly protein TadG-related protein [Candidatus Krumholzibacteria bacterium]
MKRIARILGNNRGSVLIMTAVAIMGLLAFAVLAIDGSMLMTTKNQLQTAADAAALAGASGLVNGSQDEAIARAIAYASFNQATQDVQKPVIITAADISFPESDVIRVTTHRTVATDDPLRTFFMRVLDIGSNNLSDVTAVAAAKAYDVCSSSCIKPWAIPDRFNDANENGAADPGEYDPVTTGYSVPGDVGVSVVLKVGTPQDAMAPGQFYPIDLPPLDCGCGVDPETGGDQYRWNIANCNRFTVGPGDRLQLEPGNKVGPTRQGMQELIDADPGAYWSSGDQTVKGSNFGLSPRIALVPFFDPTSPPESGRNWVRVVKVGAFFLESVGPGSQVQGRFMKVTVQGPPCAGGNGNSFLTGITLVE